VTAPVLPPLPVPRLILLRHGRTEWNSAGRFQGQLDPPLDEQGRREAARAAAQLLTSGLSADDTVVVSSDLNRAAQTARALTELLAVPLHVDARLREHGMGSWEGLTRDEVAQRYPDQYADWIAGRPVQGRGGEEAAAVGVRALAALADLPAAAVAVVVTHGGTAGRLIEALLGLGPEHRRVFGPLGNGAWSELVVQRGRWRLFRHNCAVLTTADEPRDGRVAAMSPGPGPEDPAPAPAGDADAVL
jgi:broad specificity phosphatase PhoE